MKENANVRGKKFQIGILEDDDDLRSYLASVISASENYVLSFAVRTLADARAALKTSTVDACLVDLDLPDGTGTEFIADLNANPESIVRSLVLTILGDRKSVLSAFEAGADGYLLKDAAPSEIHKSLDSVLQGETPISPQAATHLLSTFVTETSSPDLSDHPIEPLTPRELETLILFERGLSYKEAAEAMDVSHNTVRTYVKAIYEKLAVNSRNEAIFEARHLGLFKNQL